MPSHLHELLVEMFRQRPGLAGLLLRDALRFPVPDHADVRIEPNEITDLAPPQYRADTVVVLRDAETPVLAIIVEVQLRADAMKRWSWPVYVTNLRARMKCPTVLLVVCGRSSSATWCAAPIEIGHPGMTLAPMVVGPAQIPRIGAPAAARRSPELAVLSAIAHGDAPDGRPVLDALVSALVTVDPDRVDLYAEVVLAALPEAARAYLEELMTQTFEIKSNYARRHYHRGLTEGEALGEARGEARGEAKGEAKGKAKALLALLAGRGVTVPEEARVRIMRCADVGQLDEWFQRAIKATSIEDVLG